MGLNYEKRGRLEDLKDTDSDKLIGFALSENQEQYSKHDIEDVANLVNRQLDAAERKVRGLFSDR